MKDKFPVVWKILISLAFLVVAVVIPHSIFSALIAFVGLIYFALLFKKARIFFFVMIVLVFLIPALFTNVSYDFFENFGFNYNFKNMVFDNNHGMFKFNSDYEFLPDTYTEMEETIDIDLTALELYFDETSDKVYLSSELKYSHSDGKLFIEYPDYRYGKAKIIIGTKGNLKNLYLDITSGIVESNSKVFIKNFNINSTSLILEGDFESDYIYIDCTSVIINNNSKFDTKNLKIDSTSAILDFVISNNNLIDIDSTSINADIKYENVLNSKMKIDSTSGRVKILVPKEKFSNLLIENSGNGSFIKEEY